MPYTDDGFYSTDVVREKAALVAVDFGEKTEWSVSESLAELERLADTDGADTVYIATQKLNRPNPKTFIGKGKAEEIAGVCNRMDIDVVIFDDELSPSQQSNLEKIIGKKVKIIDRTALILDIFGQHAKTREGSLQVQLAQLQYILPRLRGMWSNLVTEQQRGGIGGRFGAGESQLEVDRRQIRNRISSLRKELKKLDKTRATQAKARWESGVYSVALAGYTNAGKSTLLNRLSDSDVYVQDELFATLDPTTRSIELSEGRKITVTDTVGFIQKLPHTLVESFNSTLSEVKSADLILKVVDASDKNAQKQLNAVNKVLKQIHADDINWLVVYNKCDLLDEDELNLLMATNPEAIFISALDNKGISGLLHTIAQTASENDILLTCMIPFSEGQLVNIAHERCQIIRESYTEEGLRVTARVPSELSSSFKKYEIN